MNDINEYLKKAFEYKNSNDNKKAIDFFYKALAIDNGSVEIMFELAQMYSGLCKYDRALSFYEQILSIDKDNYKAIYYSAIMYRKMNNDVQSVKLLKKLAKTDYDKEQIAEELFSIYLKQNSYNEIIQDYHSYFSLVKLHIPHLRR